MKNNKLIKYKKNVFIKIFNFIKKIFSSKNTIDKTGINQSIKNEKNNYNFLKNIQINEDGEEIRLKNLQLQYDNGEIDEEDISEEDVDKLMEMYKKETEKLNLDTEIRKKHIAQMLKELKIS